MLHLDRDTNAPIISLILFGKLINGWGGSWPSLDKHSLISILGVKTPLGLISDIYIYIYRYKELYLNFNSNHLAHCKESIPYSQALRVIERCSTPEDTSHHLANLKDKLEEINYPSKLVKEKFSKPKKKKRSNFAAKKTEKYRW